jgi:E3 ubiquitin-protein ligase DOA10
MSTCRICFEEDEDISPLISPCKCRGGSQFVHFHCIQRWIQTRETDMEDDLTCEICLEPFIFRYNRKEERSLVLNSMTIRFLTNPLSHVFIHALLSCYISMLLRLPLTFKLVVTLHLLYQWTMLLFYTLYGLFTLHKVCVYLEYTFRGGILPLFVLYSALLNIIYTVDLSHQEAGNNIILMLSIMMLGGQCLMAVYPIVHQDTILMMNRERRLVAN